MVIITIDPDAKKNLAQPTDVPLDRSFYTRLIKRLHEDGAKLIFFDLLSFDEPHANPEVDREFIEAARKHGGVVLVTRSFTAEESASTVGMRFQPIIPIVPEIQDAVGGWGLANADADTDGMVRRLYAGTDQVPTGSWIAAKILGAKVAESDANRSPSKFRWLNYYGPPGTYKRVFIDRALSEHGHEKGFFKDKIVFVGFGSEIGPAAAIQDTFPNPHYNLLPDHRLSFGVEIVALSTMNFVRGDWIHRMPFSFEVALILGWAIASILLFSAVKPWNAASLGAGAMFAFTCIGVVSQLQFHLWWGWFITVVQTPIAVFWGVGYKYLIESRQRRIISRALSAYLSPEMVAEVAEQEVDLAPGGRNVEATIMFTDLEGFTKLSESLPPDEVSRILISYFTETTQFIFEQKGMIPKYIGDAVLAVWGAMVPDPHQAERSVLAAWSMSQASKRPIEGRLLRTRIGINTGIVLAGNLGSPKRFDYTVIGDVVNFAARLEGLNKYLGTDILISETTRAELSDAIKVRALGRFRVVGKKKSVGIFEVIGVAGSFDDKQEWIATFDQGLRCFTGKRFDEAETLFRKTMELRGGVDGPSEFYLHEIPKMRGKVGEDWDGSVLIEGK